MNPIALRLSAISLELEGCGMPEIVEALQIAEREIVRLDERQVTETPMARLPKPPEWEYVGKKHSRYKGRDFYGEHADDMAELHYLRDYKAWAEEEMRRAAVEAFQ